MTSHVVSRTEAYPLAQVLAPCLFFLFAFIVAVPPFIIHFVFNPLTYIVSDKPLAVRVKLAQDKFFYFIWRVMGPMLNRNDIPIRRPLLQKAYGVCLEVGPGVGDNICFYQRSKVDRLLLCEPNVHMHPKLRANAEAAGFTDKDGSLLLLGCGGAASDEKALAAAGITAGSVDSIMAIHVLCGIPRPASAIELYRKLLKPGGLVCFYEHVRSDQEVIIKWQAFYQRVWPHVFDGCCLDRPTGAWLAGGPGAADGNSLATGKEMVNRLGGIEQSVRKRWQEIKIDSPGDQDPFTCVPHIMGYAIKA